MHIYPLYFGNPDALGSATSMDIMVHCIGSETLKVSHMIIIMVLSLRMNRRFLSYMEWQWNVTVTSKSNRTGRCRLRGAARVSGTNFLEEKKIASRLHKQLTINIQKCNENRGNFVHFMNVRKISYSFPVVGT